MRNTVPDLYWAIVLLGPTTLGKDRKQEEAGQPCTHTKAATILVGSAGVKRTLQKRPAAVCLVSTQVNECGIVLAPKHPFV